MFFAILIKMRALIKISKLDLSRLIFMVYRRKLHTRSTKVIDGRSLANTIQDRLKLEISKWVAHGNKAPHLSVIMVEGNAASETYVKMKCEAAQVVGMTTDVHKILTSTSQEDVVNIIENLNCNPDVHGILLQLPLSSQLNLRQLCNTLSPMKDVDGLTPDSLGKLCLNEPSFVPCTALAVHHIISSLGVDLTGKKAVICGRSKHVGLPIALVLHSSVRIGDQEGFNMSTTICHRYSGEQVASFTKEADVLVTAVGKPNLIKGDMVKPGAVVIDVGFNQITDANGKRRVTGDVNKSEVLKVAGKLSPVPGGVGPLTVAMLLSNTFLAARKLKNSLII